MLIGTNLKFSILVAGPHGDCGERKQGCREIAIGISHVHCFLASFDTFYLLLLLFFSINTSSDKFVFHSCFSIHRLPLAKVPTLPCSEIQRHRIFDLGTVLDSQEAREMSNQPDRMRGPDSASFEGTEMDPSDSSGVGATAEPDRSPVAVTQPAEASEADRMEATQQLAAMEEVPTDGIDGEPLSEDDLESVERGSSVDEENEEYERKKDWVMKMDDTEIDARTEKLFAHPRWNRFLKEQALPNEDTIHDKVTLLAFWEVCRPYYESAEGRPLAKPKKEQSEEKPFVLLKHADQKSLRSGKRQENQEKKNRKNAKRRTVKVAAKPKCTTKAKTKAMPKVAAKAASKRKSEENMAAGETKARRTNVDTPAPNAAAPAGDGNNTVPDAVALREDVATLAPNAAGPAEDVVISPPNAAAPALEVPDHASMQAEPSEPGAGRRRRKNPQLIDKDEQTELKQRLGFDSLVYPFDVLWLHWCCFHFFLTGKKSNCSHWLF